MKPNQIKSIRLLFKESVTHWYIILLQPAVCTIIYNFLAHKNKKFPMESS